MNSRERVLAAIRHKEPDRVPVDFGAMRSTGITALAHVRLKRHLGLAGPVQVYDLVQQLAQPEDEILDRFGIDAVDLGRAFLTDPADWRPWTLPDGAPCLVPAYFNPERQENGDWVARDADGDIVARMYHGAFYFNQEIHPLEDVPPDKWADSLPAAMAKVSWAALPSPPYHIPLDDAGLARIAETAKAFHNQTDRAIMVAFGGNLLEWGQFLRGFGNLLFDLMAEPAALERLLDRLVELHLENLRKILDAFGDAVDLIQFGDDLGTGAALQMSPEMYRRFFKPRQKKLFGYVRERGGPHVFLHSCGSIREIIGDLIDAGVEVLNPVQTSAHGMDPAELKREFGRDVTFWGGGCDTAHVLPRGTVQDVRRCVLERLEIFSKGGGYVFNQVHNVTPEVPPENVVAMFEAVREFNGG